MEHINNCDELLTHLVQAYGSYQYNCGDHIGGHIMFQGNLCEIEDCNYNRYTTLMTGPKFPNIVFAIGNCTEKDKFFLSLYSEDHSILWALSVKLPKYIKNELITTIVGCDIRPYFN